MWWFNSKRPHKHRLRLVGRTYSPPRPISIHVMGEGSVPGAIVERMAHGCTTFVWKCADSTCPEIVTVVALGKEESPE